MIFPEGPDAAQVIRDRASQFDAMDEDRAILVLSRVRINTVRLLHAVRWASPKRWSEDELVAYEYKLQSEIDAIDLAIKALS